MSIQPIKISQLDDDSKNAFLELFPVNADVYLFEFENQTFTTILSLVMNISKAIIDSSVIFVFYHPSTEGVGAWYPCPGAGTSATYITHFYMSQTQVDPSQYTLTIRTRKWDGTLHTPTKTFDKIRIYAVQLFPLNEEL